LPQTATNSLLYYVLVLSTRAFNIDKNYADYKNIIKLTISALVIKFKTYDY